MISSWWRSRRRTSRKQAELKAWCAAKIQSLRAEALELQESSDIAKRRLWQWQSLARAASEKRAEMEYYGKILAAVEEGYLIVPNFDVDVMAVKVHPDLEDAPASRNRWRPSSLDNVAPDVRMPVGVGKYVSPQPAHVVQHYDESKDPNKREMVRYFVAHGLRSPKFPVVGVKPIVLEATALAMSKQIFDQIGVVTGKRQDPVVIGTIFHPKDRFRQRRVSFFVAWWFDTRTL
jgi:hypothetical protein